MSSCTTVWAACLCLGLWLACGAGGNVRDASTAPPATETLPSEAGAGGGAGGPALPTTTGGAAGSPVPAPSPVDGPAPLAPARDAAAPGSDGAAASAPVMSYPAHTPGGPHRVDDMAPSDPCKDVSIAEGAVTIDGWTPSLWLPGGIQPIRCLIGGAGHLNELARLHHCGVMRQPPPSPAVMLKTLAAFAQMTGHPELEHVQFIGSGYSAAFGTITGIAAKMPERFLAIFGGGIHQAYPKGGMLGVPWLGFGGSRDGPNEATNNMIFKDHAAEVGAGGGLYGFTLRWGEKHENGDSRHLMFPYYHQIIPRRAPKPGAPITQLAPTAVRREDGWLMSTDDWHTPFPTIAAYADYKGDRSKASWLPDAYTAHVARAYGAGSGPAMLGRTMATPISLSQPPCNGESCTPRSAGVKSPVLYEVQVMGEAPQTLELWDGDKRLFVLPGPPPYRVQITDWTPGVHAIYALGIYASGTRVVSKPRTVIVNRVGMTSASCRRDGGS